MNPGFALPALFAPPSVMFHDLTQGDKCDNLRPIAPGIRRERILFVRKIEETPSKGGYYS